MDTVKFLVTKKTNINTKDVDQVSNILLNFTNIIVLVKLHTGEVNLISRHLTKGP